MYYVVEEYTEMDRMSKWTKYDLTPCETLDDIKRVLTRGPKHEGELKLFREIDYNLEIRLEWEGEK